MKILLLISLLFFAVFADDNEKNHHHYYSKDLTFLDLTMQQKDILKDILKEYRHDVKKYKKFKKKILKKKQKLFENESLDLNKLEELNKQVALKASHIEIKLLEEIHTILSKEQRDKFIDFIDEWEIE
ncbi:MAG: hypothetical protein WBG69_04585 [Arcobacteraceae bacterium]